MATHAELKKLVEEALGVAKRHFAEACRERGLTWSVEDGDPRDGYDVGWRLGVPEIDQGAFREAVETFQSNRYLGDAEALRAAFETAGFKIADDHE